MNSKLLNHLRYLLTLSSKKNFEEVRQLLERGIDSHFGQNVTKGIFAEYFVAELLIGNNSWAEVTAIKGDEKTDIVEYTRIGYKLIRCYQIKNQNTPLSKKDVLSEIEGFRKSNHKKLPYYILSISGFSFDKDTLNYPNVLLVDYEYVITLINNYSNKLNTSPGSTYFLQDEDFMKMFDEFTTYKKQMGTEDFYDHLPERIAVWCTRIRKQYKDGKLNIKKVRLLNSINFYWSHNNYLWERTFNRIKSTFRKYGSTFEFVNAQEKLWIKRQLQDYKKGILPLIRLNKLRAINLINEWLLNI